MHKVCVNRLKRAHIFMSQRLKRCLGVLLNQRVALERRRLGMVELGRFVVIQLLFVLVWLAIMFLMLFQYIMIFLMYLHSFILCNHLISLRPIMVIQEHSLTVLSIKVCTNSPFQVALSIFLLILRLFLFHLLKKIFLLLMPDARARQS
jgi:hypothetical protein